MIRLDTTIRSLELVLAGVVATNQPVFIVSWSDGSAANYVGGATPGTANGVTPVTLVPAPGASTVRDIDYLSVNNTDTDPVTVTIQYKDNVTTYPIITVELAVGSQLNYTHANGWEVVDKNGRTQSGVVGPKGDTGPAGQQAQAMFLDVPEEQDERSLSYAGFTKRPGGTADYQIQYKIGDNFVGNTNFSIDSQFRWLNLGNVAGVPPESVSAGSPSRISLGGTMVANKIFATSFGSNINTVLQESLWHSAVAGWFPAGGSLTVPGVFGMNAPTAVGTATARAFAATNQITRMRRLGYVSVATAGGLCGQYSTIAPLTVADFSNPGGFFYSCRFNFADVGTSAAPRAFVGLSSSIAAPTNVDPSTLTNSIGVAQLASDTSQLYIVYGGSAAQTPVPTGLAPFNAVGATGGIPYEICIFSGPITSDQIHVSLRDLTTGAFSQFDLSIDILTPGVEAPAPSTFLAHRAWRTNNASAVSVAIDIHSIYWMQGSTW